MRLDGFLFTGDITVEHGTETHEKLRDAFMLGHRVHVDMNEEGFVGDMMVTDTNTFCSNGCVRTTYTLSSIQS